MLTMRIDRPASSLRDLHGSPTAALGPDGQPSTPVKTGSAGKGDDAMDVVTGGSPRRRSAELEADVRAARDDIQRRPHAQVHNSGQDESKHAYPAA